LQSTASGGRPYPLLRETTNYRAACPVSLQHPCMLASPVAPFGCVRGGVRIAVDAAVLVVDDDRYVRRLLVATFADAPYRVADAARAGD
jgi:hypothetical protein